MPTRVPVVPNQLRGKELAFARRRSQNKEEELTECNSGGSDTEEGSYTFLPTGSSSKKRTKKKKPRRRSSGDEDSDQEPHRQPLAQSIHDNRQVQRLNSHPNMPGTRASAAGKRSSSEKDKEDAMEKENADLKLELARVKKRMKLDKTGTSASGSGSSKAMEREVGKMTKTKLWKICKFFKNDSKVLKGAKFVMENMELAEMVGLEGTEKAEAEEIWKNDYARTIRVNLNRQRNYVQQELREVMEAVFKENIEADYPNVEQMLDLIVRDKMDDQTPKEERELYEKLFDSYWDVLIPKVAGHSSWGPNKRHYGLLSFHKEDPDNKDAITYVSPSDEAFLAVIWINCYKKWAYKALCERNKVEIDPDHEDMKTPYTDSKGGQKRFGGWNADGVRKYDALVEIIEKNRKKQKKYVEDVEKEALERIRKAENVDEKDENRKTRKKSVGGSAAIMEDSTDDEDDYGSW